MTELPKTFDPAAIEARWYPHWEEKGAVPPRRGPTPSRSRSSSRRPTSPAALHIGHALDNTLQDILIRHARLQGKDALWVVGTDHAGIATQMVVERKLESQRQSSAPTSAARRSSTRSGNGRRESGGAITRQLRRLGASLRLVERALHDGRGLLGRGDQGVRPALPRGPALPRQEAGELGSQVPDRDLRSRGRDARGAGQVLAPPISARGRQRLRPGRDDAAGDDARRHGGRGASRATSATPP